MMSRTFKCLVVDDEHLARELIESHLSKLPNFEVIGSCASAIEASQLINATHVDLMFLDIEMPVLKGTEFYKNLLHKPKVIFTTAYRDYAIDGFELDAVDYLLKPIVFSRFFQAIEKFLAQQAPITTETTPSDSEPSDCIFVRANRKNVRIKLSEVLYIKGLKDYVEIVCRDNHHITKLSLTEMLSRLPKSFVQIHRSYIINQAHVTAYTQHDVEIDEHEIPIGDTFKDVVLNY